MTNWGRGCVEASASKQVKEWTNIPIIILDSEDIDANTEYLHQKDSLIETAQEIPKYPPQINDVDGVANDDFSKLWDEMTVALECSKDSPAAAAATGECVEEHGDECDHSLILKDDLGHVCRICGVIQKGIDTIIEFPSPKISSQLTFLTWYENDAAASFCEPQLPARSDLSSDPANSHLFSIVCTSIWQNWTHSYLIHITRDGPFRF
ncbi:uncharacterized protein [Euphorbia lathyris]|uniref:uncharacterized protein n=1 Tax=Euphorbia lathyris TaxID=212925 RepID=UPI0033142E37